MDNEIRTIRIIVENWQPIRIMVLRNRFRFYRRTIARESKLAELTMGWHTQVKERDLGCFDWIVRR